MNKISGFKKFSLAITTIAIITGVFHQYFALQTISQGQVTTPTAVAKEDMNCIQLKKQEGGYIGYWYCAPQKLIDKEVTRMNTEIEKLKSKTVKASVSMYSRQDSCHNRRGNVCLTAAGKDTKQGVTVACPRQIKLGTKVSINGHIYTCEDRTAKWVEEKFGGTYDIFTENQKLALEFGRKQLEVTFVN